MVCINVNKLVTLASAIHAVCQKNRTVSVENKWTRCFVASPRSLAKRSAAGPLTALITLARKFVMKVNVSLVRRTHRVKFTVHPVTKASKACWVANERAVKSLFPFVTRSVNAFYPVGSTSASSSATMTSACSVKKWSIRVVSATKPKQNSPASK